MKIPERVVYKVSSERGVTLLELIIAISLVALISGGMLTAMRTSLLTNEKVSTRLRSNREHMNLRLMISRQISGAMPVMAPCASSTGGGTDIPFFQGTPRMLRFVSSFSLSEGARGYPQVVEYQAAPAAGGFRLLVTERPYTGLASTAGFCTDGNIAPPAAVTDANSIVAADHLSRCQFSYQKPMQPIAFGDLQWVEDWTQPVLPTAVRIEMAPMAGVPEILPVLDIIVNFRSDRDFRGTILDR